MSKPYLVIKLKPKTETESDPQESITQIIPVEKVEAPGFMRDYVFPHSHQSYYEIPVLDFKELYPSVMTQAHVKELVARKAKPNQAPELAAGHYGSLLSQDFSQLYPVSSYETPELELEDDEPAIGPNVNQKPVRGPPPLITETEARKRLQDLID